MVEDEEHGVELVVAMDNPLVAVKDNIGMGLTSGLYVRWLSYMMIKIGKRR